MPAAEPFDFDALALNDVAWRHSLAEALSNGLARRLQAMQVTHGAGPQDQLAVLMAAMTEAASVICHTERGGYEASARLFANLAYQRIMELEPITAAKMKRANLRLRPDGARSD